jgi:hypothetical protein
MKLLPFGEFVRFIQVSKTLLSALLSETGVVPSQKDLDTVIALCRSITYEDLAELELKNTMHGKPWGELCGPMREMGIQVPVHLYELYKRDFTQRKKNGDYTEEEIVFMLTGGSTKVSDYFLLDGQPSVYLWNDEETRASPMLIDDEEELQESYEYLKIRGYSYNNIDAYLSDKINRPPDPPLAPSW